MTVHSLADRRATRTALHMPDPRDLRPDEQRRAVNASQWTYVGPNVHLNMLHADPSAAKAAKPGESVPAEIVGKFEFNALTLLNTIASAVTIARMAIATGEITEQQLAYAVKGQMHGME